MGCIGGYGHETTAMPMIIPTVCAHSELIYIDQLSMLLLKLNCTKMKLITWQFDCCQSFSLVVWQWCYASPRSVELDLSITWRYKKPHYHSVVTKLWKLLFLTTSHGKKYLTIVSTRYSSHSQGNEANSWDLFLQRHLGLWECAIANCLWVLHF